MSDIFVSYKREDLPGIERLIEGLRTVGFSVWLDLETPGGAGWRQTIAIQLDQARCVIVVWSHASVAVSAGWVHEEAQRAKERGVLLPVRIDRVTPPFGFAEIQSLDLVGWRGRTRDPRFTDVVEAARAIVAGERPGPPRAPARRRRTRLIQAAVGVIAAGLLIAVDVAGLQGAICRLPGVHSVCGRFNLGGVPTATETAAWNGRVPGDCIALRDYLVTFPRGAYADQAVRLLQTKTTKQVERWVEARRPLPLTVLQGEPFADEDTSRRDAIARSLEDARLACSGFDSGEFRILDATAEVGTWRCLQRDAGFLCGFDGRAICHVESRHVDEVDVCP